MIADALRGRSSELVMSDLKVEAARSRDNGAMVVDLSSRLPPPHASSGSVSRESLIGRLRRRDSGPVVSVVAPAGYGKTTLLTQWAERDGRPFAWVSVDERDNDSKVLLKGIADVLDMLEPIDKRVFDA